MVDFKCSRECATEKNREIIEEVITILSDRGLLKKDQNFTVSRCWRGNGQYTFVVKNKDNYIFKVYHMPFERLGEENRNNIIKRFSRLQKYIMARLPGFPDTEEIIYIHDWIDDIEEEYIHVQVKKYIEGESLRYLLEIAKLPITFRVCTGATLARKLLNLHKLGIMHGDLKPEQVIIEKDENGIISPFNLRIIDFDNAWVRRSWFKKAIGSPLEAATPCYMPPEVFTKDMGKPSADVYMLGVTLIELLTGRMICPEVPRFMQNPEIRASYDNAGVTFTRLNDIKKWLNETYTQIKEMNDSRYGLILPSWNPIIDTIQLNPEYRPELENIVKIMEDTCNTLNKLYIKWKLSELDHEDSNDSILIQVSDKMTNNYSAPEKDKRSKNTMLTIYSDPVEEEWFIDDWDNSDE